MVGNDHLGAAAELVDAFGRGLGRFDLDIDGVSAAADGKLEDRELLLDTAVELAVILMAPARGDDETLGKLLEEAGDRLGPFARMIEKIDAEFEEDFTG